MQGTGYAKRTLKNFEDLRVHQQSLTLVSRILTVTNNYPSSERHELASQIRRAATSMPANIAEGYSRRTRKEYVQSISISYGSCRELATHLCISLAQKYVSDSSTREAGGVSRSSHSPVPPKAKALGVPTNFVKRISRKSIPSVTRSQECSGSSWNPSPR